MREFLVDDKAELCYVDVVLQYTDAYSEYIQCFANSIPNSDGGMHLEGFKAGLTNAIKNYAKANNLLKEKDPDLTGDDLREGLVCVLSVKLTNPRFSSQTKGKLVNNEIKPLVQSITYEGVSRYCEENPAVAKKVIDKCLMAARAREAARKAREAVRKDRADRRRSAGQAGGLLRTRCQPDRTLHRGRRFRRRIRQAGP